MTGTPLGGNLSTQLAITPDHAYVDLVKAAVLKNPTGGPVAKDANGWPLADFSTLVWDGGYGGIAVDPGVYHLSFNGPSSTQVGTYLAVQGQPKVSIVKTGFNAASGLNTYNVTVPSGVTKLGFAFTHTAGQVKNVQVIQPGYDPNNYPVFTNKYVNFLKSLHPYDLRFMDFTDTNGNPAANWSDRPTPADASFASNGAPWEYVIQLANTIHTNVWINVPFHATDDYVKQLATLFKNTLDPSLNIYLEFSNEVWNTAFEQGASNAKAALAEVQAGVRSGHHSDLNYDDQPVNLKQTDTNTNEVITWADRRTARRLVQISNIFRGVWTGAGQANPIGTKVRPILGGQGPNLSRFTNMLTYVSKVYGAPKNFFYGIGIAPYWGLNLYQDQLGANGQYTTLNQNITEAQALDGMNRSITHYEVQNVFGNTLPYASQVRAEAGSLRGRRGHPRPVQHRRQEGRQPRPGHQAADGPLPQCLVQAGRRRAGLVPPGRPELQHHRRHFRHHRQPRTTSTSPRSRSTARSGGRRRRARFWCQAPHPLYRSTGTGEKRGVARREA